MYIYIYIYIHIHILHTLLFFGTVGWLSRLMNRGLIAVGGSGTRLCNRLAGRLHRQPPPTWGKAHPRRAPHSIRAPANITRKPKGHGSYVSPACNPNLDSSSHRPKDRSYTRQMGICKPEYCSCTRKILNTVAY